MDEIGIVGRMSDIEFMVHVLNYFLEEYDVVQDSLETHLVSTGEDRLTLELSEGGRTQDLKGLTLRGEREERK